MTVKTSKIKEETKLALELVANFEALAGFPLSKRKTGGRDLSGSVVPGWEDRAVFVAMDLKSRFSTPASALTAKKRLLAELAKFDKKWLKDVGTYNAVMNTLNHFRHQLNILFRDFQIQVNGEYQNRVFERSNVETRIECDPTEYLVKAENILRQVYEGATRKQVKWQDVSCAIGLVTGRRMSEIHLSGIFERLDEYTLSFHGQLKGKARQCFVDQDGYYLRECSKLEQGISLEDVKYRIITLVKADLVVAGIQWLEHESKRFDRVSGTPDQVNKTLGKYLSQRAKSDWQVITDEQWRSVDESDSWTYHKLRGLYFIVSMRQIKETMEGEDILKYAPTILGDNNVTALQPYTRIKLSPGCVTQI